MHTLAVADPSDRKPVPTGIVVEALRSLDREERTDWHRRVRDDLLGLLAAVPGGRLTIRAGADPESGVPFVVCTLRGAGKDGDDAIAAVLAPLYRTREATAAQGAAVPVRFALSRARPQVGFGTGGGTSTVPIDLELEPSRAARADLADRWLALATQLPSVALEVAVELGDAVGERYRVRLGLLTTEPLPLRMRALVLSWLPGCTLVDGPAGSVLLADRDQMRDLLPLPAGHRAGLPAVEPPPLPLRRRSEHDGAGPYRLGSGVLASGRRVDVGLGTAELVRHVHLVGHTGSGKSTAMAAVMQGFAEAGLGFVLLDPHGELVDRCVAELPAAAMERTWLIRTAELADVIPLNPIAVEDEVRFEAVVQDLVLVFYQLFDPRREGIVGPRFETLFTQAVRGLRALHGVRASLLDVPRAYRDRDLQRAIARAVSTPHLVEFWRHEMPQMSEHTRSEMLGWFTSKFDRFTTTAATRAVLSSGADAFDAAQAMDERRIILVDLSKGELGAVAADLLGFLHLNRLWTGFQRRRTTTPFGVFVDEAQSFNAGSLPAMLAEGRKRGASVVLAHQYVAQLEGRLAEAVAGSVATTLAFRTSPNDARLLQDRLGGGLPLSRFTAAADLTAILGRTSAGIAPHTLLIDHNERVRARSGEALARFKEELLVQTRRDLVEPARQAAAAAAAATSDAGEGEDEQPRHAQHEDARSPFFDDWLRKRAEIRRASAQGHEDPGVPARGGARVG